MSAPAEDWQRLDPRLIAVNLAWLAGALLPIGGTVLASGGRLDVQTMITLGCVLAAFVVVIGIGLVRRATTRYLITDERVELRSGLLFRRRRSVPLDRVRNVDITANPVHRLFGLATVTIGTGQRVGAEGDELSLDGVARRQAERLRARLLVRASSVVPGDGPIARFDRRWVRYAPLTVWSLLGLPAALGAAYSTLDKFGVTLWKLSVVQQAWAVFRSVPLVWAIGVLLAVIVLLGAIGCTALFCEAWWGFVLERDGDTAFRVRRGLLTTRSVTLERRRLRGVEVVEPLLLRWAGGARVHAVARGLAKDDEQSSSRSALLPPAPRRAAHRVAAEVLDEVRSPALSPLRPHPPAALRRRVVRAVWPVLLLAAVLGVLGALFRWMPGWAGFAALGLLPLTVFFAVDAARALGHGLGGRYLVTRYGSAIRRTVALRRDGVIGWTVRQSVFQRRSGLVTLAATVAADQGAYRVRDVRTADALAFAETAVPGLLTPFLVHDAL